MTRDRLLIDYARAHGGGSRWLLLTDASPTAAPFILLGAGRSSCTRHVGVAKRANARASMVLKAEDANMTTMQHERTARWHRAPLARNVP